MRHLLFYIIENQSNGRHIAGITFQNGRITAIQSLWFVYDTVHGLVPHVTD